MLHDGDDFKGLRMVICTLFITMNKNIGQGHWGNYQSVRTGGSLIVNTHSPTNGPQLTQKPSPKFKLDELYQRQHQQQMLARHASDE